MERGRNLEYKGIMFYIGNYTPRNNEYEKGLKYKLFVGPDRIPTDACFATLKDARAYIRREWIRYSW